MSTICPSKLLLIHLTCCYVILALAFTLVLMCCIIVLIFPEWQITSVSYLRGFPASAINALTQPYQCKSRRPCHKNKVLQTMRQQKRVFQRSSDVFAQPLSVQMLTGIICVQRNLMNPLIGSLSDCSYRHLYQTAS